MLLLGGIARFLGIAVVGWKDLQSGFRWITEPKSWRICRTAWSGVEVSRVKEVVCEKVVSNIVVVCYSRMVERWYGGPVTTGRVTVR